MRKIALDFLKKKGADVGMTDCDKNDSMD